MQMRQKQELVAVGVVAAGVVAAAAAAAK